MPYYSFQGYRKSSNHRKRLPEWLVYLPGAIILCYGLWLSLTF